MKLSILLAGAATLATFVAGCETERQDIPLMTPAAVMRLPLDQRPTIFRDPRNNQVHRTDGLSRNPADCARWGCVGVNK